MIKTLKILSKQEKERYTVPKKVQDVIPVRRIWQDGIFLTGNKFSKREYVPDLFGAAQFPGFRCGDENHHQQPAHEQGEF